MTTATDSRVLAIDLDLSLPGGGRLQGRLEHFPQGRSLVVFDEDGITLTPLTVPIADAGEHHAQLGPNEVLLRNWTDLRGVAAALVAQGHIELTGREVRIGDFRLEGLIARVR